jgi:hypothetical protein
MYVYVCFFFFCIFVCVLSEDKEKEQIIHSRRKPVVLYVYIHSFKYIYIVCRLICFVIKKKQGKFTYCENDLSRFNKRLAISEWVEVIFILKE